MRKLKKVLYEYFLFILGSVIAAFGTACFLLPNKLSSGGFSGIATIMYYISGIPMGISIVALNIPFFILAYIRKGKKFLFRTILATTIFSKFIDFFEKFPLITTDRMLASVYGGIIIGIGLALVFKGKSSTGGTDLIANIVTSYNKKVQLGEVLLLLDIAVVILNIIFLKEIEIGLFSAIAIYIINKMLDIIFEGINFSKIIYIVSDKHDEISKIINSEIKKGVTGFYGKGMYTNEDKIIIMCVAKRKDIMKIKQITQETDPNSFIIIFDARKVYGIGF